MKRCEEETAENMDECVCVCDFIYGIWPDTASIYIYSNIQRAQMELLHLHRRRHHSIQCD